MRRLIPALALAALASCAPSGAETSAASRPTALEDAPRTRREIRLTGIVEATHSFKVTVPQIIGQNARLTLTRLIPNGSRVKEGDAIAEFDPTQQLEAAFTAK